MVGRGDGYGVDRLVFENLRRSVKPAGRFLVIFSVSCKRCSSTDSSTSQMAAISTLGILAYANGHAV